MVDLKRKYFRFLQSMATSDLVDVFVSDINLPHLPQILQTAIQVAKDPTGMAHVGEGSLSRWCGVPTSSSCVYADAPSQKQAVQVLRTLVNKWMGGTDGAPTLLLSNGATFAQFTTEQIVPASFEAVLAPNFDTEDAQAGLQVVNEVANLHVGMCRHATSATR